MHARYRGSYSRSIRRHKGLGHLNDISVALENVISHSTSPLSTPWAPSFIQTKLPLRGSHPMVSPPLVEYWGFPAILTAVECCAIVGVKRGGLAG